MSEPLPDVVYDGSRMVLSPAWLHAEYISSSEEPDGLHNRHDDYLPLCLWDETPD